MHHNNRIFHLNYLCVDLFWISNLNRDIIPILLKQNLGRGIDSIVCVRHLAHCLFLA